MQGSNMLSKGNKFLLIIRHRLRTLFLFMINTSNQDRECWDRMCPSKGKKFLLLIRHRLRTLFCFKGKNSYF